MVKPIKERLTKKSFIEIFGEDPEDMFGKGWRKVVRAFLERSKDE